MTTNAPAPKFYDATPLPDMTLDFGRHKGCRLSAVPRSYVEWLANPGASKDGRAYSVPAAAQAAAQARLAGDSEPYAAFRLSGQVAPGDDTTVFVVTGEGDADGRSAHRSLDDALEAIRIGAPDRPLPYGERRDPDPEDDRILVWEVLPSGHRKVVWHFSGWHWNQDEFGLPQGTLPGDERTLYEISNDEGEGWG